MGAPASSAARAGGKALSHFAPKYRRPVTSSDKCDDNHTAGAARQSTGIKSSRGISAIIMRVSAGPPGAMTLAVTPLSARSAATMDVKASIAALEEPQGPMPPVIMVLRLVVVVMTR